MALTTAVNTLAVMLAAGLNDEELELAAVLLNQLGDTLGTIAAQRRRGLRDQTAGGVSSVGQGSPAAIAQMPPMPQETMLATAASV